MKNIQLTAIFNIQPGKEDEFRSLAASCIEAVKENDTGTSQYDWFYSEDGLECHVREIYEDSAAVFVHMGSVGALLEPILAVSEFSGVVYGNPSEELKEALSTLNLRYFSYGGGI